MSIIFKIQKYLKNYSNLIASVIIIALVVVLTVQSVSLNNYKSSYQEEVKLGSAIQTELDLVNKQNKILEKKVLKLEAQLASNETELSNKEAQIQKLTKEVEDLKTQLDKAKKTINSQSSFNKSSSSGTISNQNSFKADGNYSQATKIWNALRALGLNKYVCAGIIGNIMAEVGGQTLDISRWPQYSQGTYYGICQWAGSRRQRLLNNFGTTLEDQIKFLSVELFEVIPKGSSFYNMQDEQEAALYFAKYYERCGSGSYSVRQSNATKALQYFT